MAIHNHATFINEFMKYYDEIFCFFVSVAWVEAFFRFVVFCGTGCGCGVDVGVG